MSARDDAYKDWQSGMKYQEIADKYGVSLSTVKSWATRYWKNQDAKKVATKGKKKLQPSQKKLQPKKGGAPPGNTNAKGNKGGAPPGNTNNFKHGFYMSVLPAEAREMIESRGEISEEQRLLNDLNLWEYRERCLVEAIEKHKANAAGLAMERVTKGKDGTTTTAVSTFTNIAHLEKLLSDAQRGYNRCIMALNELRVNRKLNGVTDPEDSPDNVTFYEIPDNGRDET